MHRVYVFGGLYVDRFRSKNSYMYLAAKDRRGGNWEQYTILILWARRPGLLRAGACPGFGNSPREEPKESRQMGRKPCRRTESRNMSCHIPPKGGKRSWRINRPMESHKFPPH